MNTYKFQGTQTVIWFSLKTNRAMAPSSRPVKIIVRSDSFENAFAAIQVQVESQVNNTQKRTIALSGNVTKLAHNNESSLGKIEGVVRFPDRP